MIIKESNSFDEMCIARVTNSKWKKQYFLCVVRLVGDILLVPSQGVSALVTSGPGELRVCVLPFWGLR